MVLTHSTQFFALIVFSWLARADYPIEEDEEEEGVGEEEGGQEDEEGGRKYTILLH